MTEVPKITDFHKVVEPHLNGSKLLSYTARYLNKPGDNYGSLMLAVTAIIKRVDGQIEELPLIAKLPPLTNDLYWQIFQPERTCITENATYKYVGPLLKNLQLDAGITDDDELFDPFPRYYGSRISLDDTATKVDRDAVLVQENVQVSGFKPGNRHKLFDFGHTKFLLENIAKYHALPIALRLKKPEDFDKYVRPYFKRFNLNNSLSPEVRNQLNVETFAEVALATNNNENLVQKFKNLMKSSDEYFAKPDVIENNYTSLAHCDLWTNNIMLQYAEDGTPSKVKIVDFQVAQYESLMHDVVFFLFSSVETAVLEHHFDNFLKIYHNAFVLCLQNVGVSTAKYTFEAFMVELHRVAPLEISHATYMTKVILAETNTFPEDFKDLDMNVFSKNKGVPAITKKTGDILRLAQKFKFIE